MVLGGDDDTFGAGGFGDAAPLPAVQVGRIEYFFLFRPLTPFEIRESIGSEMGEEIEFLVLPCQLTSGRQGPGDGCASRATVAISAISRLMALFGISAIFGKSFLYMSVLQAIYP